MKQFTYRVTFRHQELSPEITIEATDLSTANTAVKETLDFEVTGEKDAEASKKPEAN